VHLPGLESLRAVYEKARAMGSMKKRVQWGKVTLITRPLSKWSKVT